MNKAPRKHAALERLKYVDGTLAWGGRKVSDIADELGQTPFYVYSREMMTDRVHDLRAAMPDSLSIHYAMKANPMPDVVAHMIGLVDGLDVASGKELGVGLAAAADPANVSFAGPGKQAQELMDAIEAGITINMESEVEMRRIARLSEEVGKRARVAIRVNPDFELKSAGMKMGGRPSQFGVDAERVPAMLEELRGTGLEFRGFHIFSGSQNLRAEAISESMVKTVELVLQLTRSAPIDVATINLGGGIGIPYFPNEQPADLQPIGETAATAIDRLRTALGDVEVIMELGRYLVGEAGLYVVKVIEVKESRGSVYAVCDGGMHQHLAASGNFGQVIRKNYPLANVIEPAEEMIEISVVGPLCTPLDLLGDRVELAPVKSGSLIAVMQSGAYGFTASPRDFLSHPPCAEILV